MLPLTNPAKPFPGMAAPSTECHACGQPDPVRLRHLVRTSFTTRRVPGFVWVTIGVRVSWERPSATHLVRGIVGRYAAGPFLVLAMPKDRT